MWQTAPKPQWLLIQRSRYWLIGINRCHLSLFISMGREQVKPQNISDHCSDHAQWYSIGLWRKRRQNKQVGVHERRVHVVSRKGAMTKWDTFASGNYSTWGQPDIVPPLSESQDSSSSSLLVPSPLWLTEAEDLQILTPLPVSQCGVKYGVRIGSKTFTGCPQSHPLPQLCIWASESLGFSWEDSLDSSLTAVLLAAFYSKIKLLPNCWFSCWPGPRLLFL
jgi:hypothetical protein